MDGGFGDETAVYRANFQQAHEDHVTGHTGCPWYEVMLACYPIFPGTLIINRLLAVGEWTVVSANVSAVFVLELVLCVLPLVFVLTALHKHLTTVAATLTLVAIIVAAATHPPRKNKSRLPGIAPSSSALPCVTLVRSFVGLNTAIAILAVDCHAFPRRFAKTEQSGYSVMDTGAAAFIFINALVDVLPSRRYSVRGVLKGCAVLTVLGVVRLAALHLTQYPQHSTEYGIHSNFFFVLAFVKLVCQPLCRLLVYSLPLPGVVSPLLLLLVAAALTAAQERNVTANKIWILGDQPRDTLINANRETLVGLPGYFALYFWGSLIGLGLFEIRRRPRSSLLCRAAVPCVGVAVWAAMFWLPSVAQEPSRRLINREFILWMVLLLLVLLSLSCALEDYLTQVQSTKTDVNFVPPVMQAINRHQLEFFLAANLLTGAVNVSVDTLSLQYPVDVGLICVYIVTLCAGVLVWSGGRR